MRFVLLVFAVWWCASAPMSAEADVGSSHAVLTASDGVAPATVASALTSPTTGRLRRFVANVVEVPSQRFLADIVLSWPFWVTLAITLICERFIPAERDSGPFRVDVRQDVVWFLYEPFLNAVVVGTSIAALVKLHAWYAPSLVVELGGTPGWARVLLVFVITDFGLWLQHYLHHKVPFLWRLHAVHHAQRSLNFFTDFRYHALEYVLRRIVVVLPLLLLKVDPPVIVAVVVFRDWYSRFYHGNIRTNLGPLRYVLVTPQSHRIHHSIELRHRDRNFGALLSIWDRSFGTHYEGSDEYPRTGIVDDRFPVSDSGWGALLLGPWRQMAYSLRPPA